MKAKLRTRICLLVTLLAVLGSVILILPLSQLRAQAAPATTLTLIDSEGIETSYNADASGAGWEWDVDTATLTLDGWSGKHIAANGDLYLHLKGTNTLTLIDEYNTSGIETNWNTLYVSAEDDGVLNVEGTLTNAFMAFETPVVITNGTINANISTSAYSSSHVFYGTVEFDTENIEKPVVINVTAENTYDGVSYLYGFGNGGFDIADRDNVTVNVNLTGTQKTYLTGIDDLEYENSAAKITVVANNNGGELGGRIALGGFSTIAMKEGGSIDLTGCVVDYNANYKTTPNTVTTTPADNAFVFVKNQAVHNSYLVLCDTNGDPVEHTVFAYTDTPAEGLVWCGEGILEIPSVYLEEWVDVNLIAGIRGACDYSYSNWSGEVIEGELPQGYQISGTGISGTATTPCEADSVTIGFTNKGENYWDSADDLYIEFEVAYGAVLEKDKFIVIDGGEPIEMRTDASGEGWSYDGKTATLTLEGYNGGPIKAEKALTILLKGENTITLSDSVLYDSRAYGIVVEYEGSPKDLYITAELGGKLNIVGNLTEGFSGIDAWFYLYGGTVNIDITSSLSDQYNDVGYAVNNDLNFGEDDSIPAAFFATLRYTDPKGKGNLYCAPNGGIDIENRDNVTVGIYLYAASEAADLSGASNLSLENSGAHVTIVTDNGGGASDKSVAVGYINTMRLREGGYVDLTGKVELLNNHDISTNLNTTISIPAEGAYTKARYQGGDFAICNLDGTLAERTVFTYTAEPTTLKWVGNGRAFLPAGDVGQSIADVDLWTYLQGGNGGGSWSFEIVEGTLPQGIQMSSSLYFAKLWGTYAETCEADSVTIRATDTYSAQSIEFVIPYGAVSEKKPVTEVAFEQDTYIANVGEEWTVTVFVTPDNASEWVLSANYTGAGVEDIEYMGDGSAILHLRAAYEAGVYQIKIVHEETGLSATATVYVREETPEIYIYDYIDEELGGFTWGATYTITGEGVTTKVIENATSYITIDPEWFGKTLQIIKNNAEAGSNSPVQELSIPARPAAPNVIGVDAPKAEGNGSVIGVDAIDGSLKYREAESSYWYSLYEGKPLAPGIYYARIEAVYDKNFASEEKEIVIGYQALAASPVPAIPAGGSGTYYYIDLRQYVNGGCGTYTFAFEGEAPVWLTCQDYGTLYGYRQIGDAAAVTVRVTDTGDIEKGIEPASITFEIAIGAVTDLGAHECVFDQEVALPYYCKNGATCTSAELYYMSCVCGKFTYDADFEYGDPLGHKFENAYEYVEHLRSEGANCQEYNTYWYSCSVCAAISDELWFSSQSTCGDHIYSDVLSSINQYTHANVCTVEGCDDYINSASHSKGEAATENTACTCTACDYVYEAAKGHTIIRIAAKAATCTHAGNIEYYVCIAGCGKLFSDALGVEEITDPATVTIAALGHDYSEKLETPSHYKVESDNCQEAHIYWLNCSRCSASARDDAEAEDKFYTGSTFGAHHFDTENWGYQGIDGHAHLCTVDGCGAHSEVEEHNIQWQYKTNETHHWKECSGCGYHAEETEHNYDNVCDSYCNTCSEHRDAPHDYDMETWYSNFMQHYRMCKLCEHMGSIEDHTLSDEKVYDESQHWQVCEVCEFAKNYVQHTFENNCDTTCSDCTYVREITHQNDYLFEQQDATCTDTGMKAHYQCNICNVYFDLEKNVVLESELIIPINPEAHGWGNWVTNGDGTHTRICTHNEAHKESGECEGGTATCTHKAECEKCHTPHGELLAHTFDEKVERVDATCVQNGMQAHFRCLTCAGYFDEEKIEKTQEQLIIEIDPTAHSFGKWVSNGDGTHTHKCTRNDEHTETADCSGGEATCTEKAICDSCETAYGTLLPHTFSDPIAEVPATHTAFELLAGMKAHYRCTACEGYFDSEKNPTTQGELVIPAPTHAFGEWITSDSEQHWKVCSCGLKNSVGAHEYDDEADMICNTCAYDRTIPHTHGDGELVSGQAATCTENGWKDYYRCSCGNLYADAACTNAIATLEEWKLGEGKIAASHTLSEKVAATEANCTTTGMKEHYRCTVCEAYFDAEKNVTTAQELTVAINDSHAFGAWASNGDNTHSRVCANNAEHKETLGCEGGEATCTEKAICTTCNTAYGQPKGHNYSEATCTQKATCSVCGEETGELAAHDYSEATCTKKATCSVCGDETGELAPHDYSEATCTKKATCSVCGDETGELAAHDYSEATCTKKATCSVCEAETGELAPHAYSEATCLQKATCSACGDVSGDFAPHAYGDLVEEVPATHTASELLAGMKAHYQCSVCNAYFDSAKNATTEGELIIPAPTHAFGDWITADSDKHWKVCSCGLKDAEAAHEYDDELDMICNVCSHDRTAPHTHGNGELVGGQAATCTENGWKDYYRCSCGNIYADADCTTPIASLEEWKSGDGKIVAAHTLGDLIEKVEPDCTTPGKQAHYKCSVCGTLFDEEENVKAEQELLIPTNDNHTFGQWTSNEDGTHSRICANNAEHKETAKCEGGEATCTEKAVCSICGTAYGNFAAHDYSEATCTKKATCSVCGEETGELVPHDYSEATCTKKATCSVCGEETGELVPHDYSEATCTKKATCSVCGEETGELVPHDYSEATCTKKATCSVCEAETGDFAAHNYSEATCTAKAKCSVCGEETGELVPHDYSEATCIKKATCSVCEAETGDFAAHNYSEATCTAKAKCSVCGEETGELADHVDGNTDGKCDACEYQMTPVTPEDPKPEDPKPEDPKDEEKGLSGGAIAGIVVGSTVVAAGGGFAVYWFVIKKQTAAQLGEAAKALIEKIKRLFAKKQ